VLVENDRVIVFSKEKIVKAERLRLNPVYIDILKVDKKMQIP